MIMVLGLVHMFNYGFSNITISNNTIISNAGLALLNDGDTLFVNAELRINIDFSLAFVQDLVIIVGSNGAIHYNPSDNNQLTLDSSVTLILENGALSPLSGGGCQNQKKIFLNSVEYANCGGGSPSNKSFQDVQNDGGILPGGIPLPVTLGSINSVIKNNALTISWVTFMEYNSSHFEIENLVDEEWHLLDIVHSENKINGSKYSWSIPLEPFNDALFIRLKMVDFDGTYEYSPVVRISKTNRFENNLTIYPNPTNDVLKVTIDKTIQKLEIIDMSGRLLLEQSGDSNIISMQDLESGIYIIRVIDDWNQVSEKRVVKY